MIDIGSLDLPLDRTALFLDIDGTLLDLAPRPDAVVVPDRLRADLATLRGRLAGALALVSGRAVAEIDRLFAPLSLPASGVHGSEFRPDPSRPATRLAPLIPEPVRTQAQTIVDDHPGALLEDKGVAIALHWRLAPQAGDAIMAQAAALVAAMPAGLGLLRGHCVVEIKGVTQDKGRAVERFLAGSPFAGRCPVFVGDDVTDQAAFAVVARHGGLALAVGRPIEGARDWFASPNDVRDWLGRLARSGAP